MKLKWREDFKKIGYKRLIATGKGYCWRLEKYNDCYLSSLCGTIRDLHFRTLKAAKQMAQLIEDG